MIYIQSDKERKLPHHFDAACALYGAIEGALDYRLTTFEEVASGKFDALIRQRLFVGSVEFMREVFKRINLLDVRLPANSNRKHQVMTLREAQIVWRAAGQKLFIKPVEIKLFTGLVLDGVVHSCLDGLPEDTKVMAYEPFDSPIISEWRFYIHNHQVVDGHNYSGDCFKIPFAGNVLNVVAANKDTFPCAYTIDMAVLQDESNVVVEFNDMWAIGNYGMPNFLYLRLLKDRYFEIISTLKLSEVIQIP